jgi:hypothetical protein
MGRKMAHGRQQRRNKSRGEAGITNCSLCGFEAENSAAFQIHLEDFRHKYNFKLAEFKGKRSVYSVVHCPRLFVYRTGKCCRLCQMYVK